MHTLTFAESAVKELGALDQALRVRIVEKILLLAGDPRPAGCQKIQSASGLWRIHIGDYRVIYSVDDDQNVVDVVFIRHRSDAYR